METDFTVDTGHDESLESRYKLSLIVYVTLENESLQFGFYMLLRKLILATYVGDYLLIT